ncbi:hypothetical protein V8G54_015272 [Vigna mungo]|uniref:Uncharacterized protein n=1 Tax=Vigna mungo TaxID=3915 RepID=A0AAQ3RY96_VIGMU
MVDHLEEPPLSACTAYFPHNLFKTNLRRRSTHQRGEIYHRDSLFNHTNLCPVLFCLNESFIYLSHALSLTISVFAIQRSGRRVRNIESISVPVIYKYTFRQ